MGFGQGNIFSQNIFFALTPVFSVDFFYNITHHDTKIWHSILSQSTAVFPQSVEMWLTPGMHEKINTVIYRETGII